MAYLAFWLILVGGKAALMYGVWRHAKTQGISPWPPFISSIFCASIVFFALFIKGAPTPYQSKKFKLIHCQTDR